MFSLVYHSILHIPCYIVCNTVLRHHCQLYFLLPKQNILQGILHQSIVHSTLLSQTNGIYKRYIIRNFGSRQGKINHIFCRLNQFHQKILHLHMQHFCNTHSFMNSRVDLLLSKQQNPRIPCNLKYLGQYNQYKSDYMTRKILHIFSRYNSLKDTCLCTNSSIKICRLGMQDNDHDQVQNMTTHTFMNLYIIIIKLKSMILK